MLRQRLCQQTRVSIFMTAKDVEPYCAQTKATVVSFAHTALLRARRSRLVAVTVQLSGEPLI